VTLNPAVQVPLPECGVTVRHTGYPAVYKVLRSYRNAKGQWACERINIGKLDRSTNKLIPNQAYWEHYGDTSTLEILPEDSIRLVGASFLIGSLMKSLGITDILNARLGEERASLVRTAVIHMVAVGNVFEYVMDFCKGSTLSEAPLTSQTASELFSSISHAERMGFFKSWVDKHHQDDSYFAYDVTSFSTYAKDIIDKEWGYNRDGERLPQINLGCYLSETTGLPMFYVTYPGSILDKSQLPHMMAYNDDLGISDVGFVLDRGFCSTDNVKDMAKNGWKYVLGVEKRHKTTRLAMDIARETIFLMRSRIRQNVHAASVKGTFYGVPSVMHVFYDPIKAENQRRHMLDDIESMAAELGKLKELTPRDVKHYKTFFLIRWNEDGSFSYERNHEKIEARSADCGFFCVLTYTGLDSEETLAKYRRKDVIEKAFDDVKNHIDMKRLRTHNSETTDGKLFCAFLALIVVSEIEIKLGDYLRENCWSKSHLISEMDKIRVTISPTGRRLMHAVTKTQRIILAKFGLTVEDVKAYVLDHRHS
jgi:transposase